MWNEWKRIWRHPKRCMILLLLPVFCMFMFWEGEAEGIRISDGVEMIRHSQIYKKHVEICQSMEWEAAESWLREEQDHLASASLWAGGYLEGEVMREEVENWLQDYPDLLRLMEDTVAFRLEISWYGEMLGTLESELKYLREYPEYLEQIQAQYRSQSESSLFQNATPYFQRKLKKTADDFRPLTGVQLAFGHNQGLDAWLNFRLTDYVYLAVLLIVVFSFLEERRKGLWDAIRSTTGGRWRLGLSRIGILSCISILYTCMGARWQAL